MEAEVFLADGKRIVHRLVETQLEYEDKVLDVLVYVGQVFGNVPGDGLVTILHVGYEYVQVVVFLGQDIGEVHAE